MTSTAEAMSSQRPRHCTNCSLGIVRMPKARSASLQRLSQSGEVTCRKQSMRFSARPCLAA